MRNMFLSELSDMDEERCKPDPTLIEKGLQHPLALRWNTRIDQPYKLTVIEPHLTEYNKISSFFAKTSRGITIKKLERVENPYLLGHYLLRMEILKQKGFVEASLYHGTHEKNIDGICKYNFDWRKYGTSGGHKFGRGVCFTPQVSYALHYTPSRERVMILARVLICKSTIGNHLTKIPPEPSDTTRNRAGSVYVKYEDNDFYPQFVIHF